jgi:hypothetical protein
MFEVLLLLGFFAAGMCQLLPPAAEGDPERSPEAPARAADGQKQEGRRSRRSRKSQRAGERLPKSRAQASRASYRAGDNMQSRRPANGGQALNGNVTLAGKNRLIFESATGRGRLARTW